MAAATAAASADSRVSANKRAFPLSLPRDFLGSSLKASKVGDGRSGPARCDGGNVNRVPSLHHAVPLRRLGPRGALEPYRMIESSRQLYASFNACRGKSSSAPCTECVLSVRMRHMN